METPMSEHKHEDGCAMPNYMKLHMISKLFKLAALIILILGIIATLWVIMMPAGGNYMMPGYEQGMKWGMGGGHRLAMVICTLFMTFWCTLIAMTIAHVLKLFINVASDINHLQIHMK